MEELEPQFLEPDPALPLPGSVSEVVTPGIEMTPDIPVLDQLAEYGPLYAVIAVLIGVGGYLLRLLLSSWRERLAENREMLVFINASTAEMQANKAVIAGSAELTKSLLSQLGQLPVLIDQMKNLVGEIDQLKRDLQSTTRRPSR